MKNSLQLFTASSGKLSARVILEDDTVRHLHSTVKPEAETDYFQNVTFWGNVIIFTGVGLGYHLAEKAAQIPSTATIVVIEYYDELLKYSCNGIFKNVTNEIITFSSSSVSDEKVKEVKKKLLDIPDTRIQIIKHPASYDINSFFYDDLLKKIAAPVKFKTVKTARYKKCLLLIGTFFLQDECRRALREITGEEPALFEYEKISSDPVYESELQRVIQNEKPDFILSINMKGFDGSGILGATAQRAGLPAIIWFVDDPHPILLAKENALTNQMIACCWEKTYLPFLSGKGFRKAHYLPLATDPSVFSGEPVTSSATRLGFIGSSMSGVFLSEIKRRFLWSESLVPLINQVSDNLLENPEVNIYTLVKMYCEKTGVPLPFSDKRNMTWLCAYCIHTASMKKRRDIIRALIPSGIETFGDPEGWKQLFGAQIVTHPDLDYATQLRNAYRNIAVNVNSTSCQMPSAVNQRVFDIPMAGSFVVSDSQKDLSSLFTINKEAVCYGDTKELRDIVHYYIKNVSARLRIVKAAQRRISSEHTYVHRMKTVMDILTH